MTNKTNLSGKNKPAFITCLKCNSKNPPTAYCCINCFKVLREKPEVPFWQMRFNPGVGVFVVVIAVALAGILFFKAWLENIDAEVNMHFASADYSLSLAANKKGGQKKFNLIDVISGKKKAPEIRSADESLVPSTDPAPDVNAVP